MAMFNMIALIFFDSSLVLVFVRMLNNCNIPRTVKMKLIADIKPTGTKMKPIRFVAFR